MELHSEMFFVILCLNSEQIHFTMVTSFYLFSLLQVALQRPILYSNWLTKDYLPVEQEELRDYVHARLKVFYEEELDVQLVLFNEVLDHVLRIDRIFKQSQVEYHMISLFLLL